MSSTEQNLQDLYDKEALQDTPPVWYEFPDAWPKFRWEAAYRLCPGGDSVLELGFGDGNLLYNLAKKYKSVAGVDLAAPRVSNVSKMLDDRGLSNQITVEQSDSGQALIERFGSNSFDCVVWNDVIEHVIDIHGSMRVLSQLIKPKGSIVTVTPNIGYIKHRMTLARGKFPSTSAPNEGISETDYGLIDGGHIHYLTFSAIQRLHAIHGFGESHKKLGFGRLGRLHNFAPSLLSGGAAVRSTSSS